MQPSSIKVAYRRTKQPKQYETAEASAEAEFVFAEGEEVDVDNVLSTELSRLQNNVNSVLGIGPAEAPKTPASPTKPASAPKATAPATPPAGTQASGTKPPSPSGQTATKPASPSKPATPKPAAKPAVSKPAAPKPAAAEKTLTKNDAMKAISSVMTELQKKGITDGQKRIEKIVLGYLPDDNPPISYTRIPPDSIGDFISDVEKLKKAEE